MPSVGILTFIRMMNTTSERLKARNFFIGQYFSFYDLLNFCAQMNFFYNLGAGTVKRHRVVCAFVVSIQHDRIFSQWGP